MKPQAGKRKLKPSGIDWIGDVPEGWNVMRLKYACSTITDGSHFSPECVDEGFPYVTATDVRGVGIDFSKTKFISEEAYDLLVSAGCGLKQNDVLMVKDGATTGRVGMMTEDVAAVALSSVAILRTPDDVDRKFLYWGLQGDGFQRNVQQTMAGSAMPRITVWKLGQYNIAIPPLDEQKRIAAKLDRLCGHIDELSANLTKEIAALQDYRKSLITECVTKGLDPKAKMKPSGVEWIGKIPTGWTVMRLKYACSTITDGSHFSPECVDDGYPYVTATDVRGVGIDFERTKFVSEADYHALVVAGCGLKRDDVLMVKDGATTGRVGMMTDNIKAVALSSVAILRAPEDVDRKFLYWGLQSDGLQRNIQQTMAGSAMPRITVWKLGQYNIALPSIDEQKGIAAYLDKHCAVIDSKIEERKGQLEKLAEYRASAIYEYVTGKKSV